MIDDETARMNVLTTAMTLENAASPALLAWIRAHYTWFLNTMVPARVAALGITPDASDPDYLREFALATRSGDALTPVELANALVRAGITAESTQKALRRALYDPRTIGEQLYDVDAVARWVYDNREKARESAQRRAESGAPVRSTKQVEAALQWAKYADDGRYPSLASLLFDAQNNRHAYQRSKGARQSYARKIAQKYLESSKGYEDQIVQRYTDAMAKKAAAKRERAARAPTAPVVEVEAPRLYRYGAQNRPIGFATVPKGHVKIEPPVAGQPLTRHGVVVYDRPLTADEVRGYELAAFMDADTLVEKLYADVAEYGAEYADFIREDGIDAFRVQLEVQLPENVYTDVPFAELTRRVADRLLAAYPAPPAAPTPHPDPDVGRGAIVAPKLPAGWRVDRVGDSVRAYKDGAQIGEVTRRWGDVAWSPSTPRTRDFGINLPKAVIVAMMAALNA